MDPKRAAKIAMMAQISELLLLGASTEEMSALMQVPKRDIRRMIATVARRDEVTSQANIDRHKALQIERTEDLISSHWYKATALRSKDSSQVVLACMKRQSQLLGLDAPRKTDVQMRAQVQVDLANRSADELRQAEETLERIIEADKKAIPAEVIDVESESL